MTHRDILIAGAGIAGLAAGRRLAEAGARVTLLEARERVGGRMSSVRHPECDLALELGAEFVHGRPPELLELIDEAGLTVFEIGGEHICFENGILDECAHEEAFAVLDEMTAEPDRSFAEWIGSQDVPEEVAARAKNYVEGFNAADASVIGTAALVKQQKAEEEIEGYRAFRVEQGYERLAEFLLERFTAAGGEVHLQTEMRRVEWGAGFVSATAKAASGEEVVFSAPRCVIALPLGVLQARSVRFQPESSTAIAAIDQMAMGTARRMTLLFREAFWRERFPGTSFLFARDGIPGTFWTASPHSAATLTAWVGGTRAAAVPGDAEGFEKLALAALGRIFGVSQEWLKSMLVTAATHDWQSDPYSLGAYSYAPKGALHASDTLAQPVEGTLFFAGEHTDTTGHWGTVHGALRSGLRAADQVLAQLRAAEP
jgi:monoamine oxidase